MKQSIKYIGFLILMFVVFTPEAFANSLVPSSLTMVQSVPYSQVVVCAGGGNIGSTDPGSLPPGISVAQTTQTSLTYSGTPTASGSFSDTDFCVTGLQSIVLPITVSSPPPPTPTPQYLILGGLVKVETGSIGSILLTGMCRNIWSRP